MLHSSGLAPRLHLAAQKTVQDIALVEMSGDRIARICDYMPQADYALK
jgi:hypothetical protein